MEKDGSRENRCARLCAGWIEPWKAQRITQPCLCLLGDRRILAEPGRGSQSIMLRHFSGHKTFMSYAFDKSSGSLEILSAASMLDVVLTMNRWRG